MSDDRYPTDEELQRITTWPHTDSLGLMDFVRSVWWMPDWGWRQEVKPPEEGDLLHSEPYTHFAISTGGWSGNESIIYALEANWMFWMMCWTQSRRGGHYVFEVRELTKSSPWWSYRADERQADQA